MSWTLQLVLCIKRSVVNSVNGDHVLQFTDSSYDSIVLCNNYEALCDPLPDLSPVQSLTPCYNCTCMLWIRFLNLYALFDKL